ncbi:MAG: 6-phosphogluconolactonase, partial [Candidatus Eisenbacteria bacterium]
MEDPQVTVAEAPVLSETFAGWVESAAQEAIAARGRFVFVIPGGSAAEQFLPRLGSARLDWTRTHVLYSDERFVSRNDPASSAAASMRLLFTALGTRGPHVHPLVETANDPAREAERYTAKLTDLLGPEPTPDLALLGIGEDGHVASLFPGRASLEVTAACVVVERDSPKPPSTRLTLSLPLLARARTLVIAAFGAGKAEPLRAVL